MFGMHFKHRTSVCISQNDWRWRNKRNKSETSFQGKYLWLTSSSSRNWMRGVLQNMVKTVFRMWNFPKCVLYCSYEHNFINITKNSFTWAPAFLHYCLNCLIIGLLVWICSWWAHTHTHILQPPALGNFHSCTERGREGKRNRWMDGREEGREGDLVSGYTSVKQWTSKSWPHYKTHITFSVNLINSEEAEATVCLPGFWMNLFIKPSHLSFPFLSI